jgi:hypothetical protein
MSTISFSVVSFELEELLPSEPFARRRRRRFFLLKEKELCVTVGDTVGGLDSAHTSRRFPMIFNKK